MHREASLISSTVADVRVWRAWWTWRSWLAPRSQTAEKRGVVSARAVRSRPACITVWSGLTSAATEWPFESQAPSFRSRSTSRILVPRPPRRRRCSTGGRQRGDEQEAADCEVVQPPAVSSSALGHSCPPSDRVNRGGARERSGTAEGSRCRGCGRAAQGPSADAERQRAGGGCRSGRHGSSPAPMSGQPDHRPGVRLALGLVGVEHRLRKVSARTPASFQLRFMASRRPAQRP